MERWRDDDIAIKRWSDGDDTMEQNGDDRILCRFIAIASSPSLHSFMAISLSLHRVYVDIYKRTLTHFNTSYIAPLDFKKLPAA